MDMPADQSTRTVAQRIPPETVRRARRRRPTGEAPPLPYHLQTSGVGWLIAAVALVALTVVVFARGLRGLAVVVNRHGFRAVFIRAAAPVGVQHSSRLRARRGYAFPGWCAGVGC